jgi:hypothetical protein
MLKLQPLQTTTLLGCVLAFGLEGMENRAIKNKINPPAENAMSLMLSRTATQYDMSQVSSELSLIFYAASTFGLRSAYESIQSARLKCLFQPRMTGTLA